MNTMKIDDIANEDKILERLYLHIRKFNQFKIFFHMEEIKISKFRLYESIIIYFLETNSLKQNNGNIKNTNASKRCALTIHSLESTKPIRIPKSCYEDKEDLLSSFKYRYINECFAIYCGISHFQEKTFKKAVLANIKEFIYLLRKRNIDYHQFMVTLDTFYKGNKWQ